MGKKQRIVTIEVWFDEDEIINEETIRNQIENNDLSYEVDGQEYDTGKTLRIQQIDTEVEACETAIRDSYTAKEVKELERRIQELTEQRFKVENDY